MRCLVALVVIFFGAPVASANQIPHTMQVGEYTSQPIGHYEFCLKYPAECRIKMPDVGPVHLTPALRKEINDSNTFYNGAFVPMNDINIYGKDEVWAYPLKYADCEDYVLEKRRDLSSIIPLNDLLITVVRKQDGEGHAVLTVRTDDGDYILDNLTDKVVTFDQTNYRYLKRQSTRNTGRWVSITEDSTLVGSIN